MSKLTEALGEQSAIVRIRRTTHSIPDKLYETPVPQEAVQDGWEYEDEWWGS